MKVLARNSSGGLAIVGPGRFDIFHATLTIAAESGDDVDVTIQLVDTAGKTMRVPNVALFCYYSANTVDDFAAGTAVTTMVCPTAAQLLKSYTTGLRNTFYTDANGAVVVRGTIAGAATRRLCVIMPDGHVVQSGTITWT